MRLNIITEKNIMLVEKKLGIWMDNENAHLIEFSMDREIRKTIHSKFNHSTKEFTLSKSENLMHNKEQHQQLEYYKEIAEGIRKYTQVIIFGPTNAKAELHNHLKANHLFDKISIETQTSDKMTNLEQLEFVRNHFETD